MKKITLFSAVLILVYLINVPPSHATVGGPTFISNIQTDAKGQEIIYEIWFQSGKGCPPELHSYNLQIGLKKVLLSCDELLKLSNRDQMVETEVTMSKYPVMLKRIDLNKNKITAVSTVTDEQKYDELKGLFGKTSFSLDIFQDGIKKTTYVYQGCKPEQQQIIDGYRIPNSKFMILILSTTGNCFEGGYTKQHMIVVPNTTIYDANALSITTNATPTPGNGRITLVAKNPTGTTNQSSEETGQISTEENTTANTPNNSALNYQIFIGVLLVIILALIFKKSTR